MSITNRIPFDDCGNQLAKMDDLSRDLILEFLQESNSSLINEARQLPILALGKKMQIIVGPRDAPLPSNVGLLFFNPEPDQFFPQTKINVVAFGKKGPGADTFAQKTFLGPLPRMIREALTYIKSNFISDIVIKHPDRAEATRVQNFPFAAIEEALVNAVYHRSYQVREPVEVRILKDALIILSYPGPDRSVQMDILRAGNITARCYRNRRIGEFLRRLHLTEEQATGINKILNAMRENGSPPPEFKTDENRTHFEVRLPVHPAMVAMFSSMAESGIAHAQAFHLPEMRLSPHFADPLNHLAELRLQLTSKKSAAVLAATTVQGMAGWGRRSWR